MSLAIVPDVDIHHLSDEDLEMLAALWFTAETIDNWLRRTQMNDQYRRQHVRGGLINIARAGIDEQRNFPDTDLAEAIQLHPEFKHFFRVGYTPAINGLSLLEVLTRPLAQKGVRRRKAPKFTEPRIKVLELFLTRILECHHGLR